MLCNLLENTKAGKTIICSTIERLRPMHDIRDRLRGMLLLGAYGDALGAVHEGSPKVADEPFPKVLPLRTMPNQGFHWGTWLPNTVVASKAGVPTDDTSFRLFILHPWLQQIALGHSSFSEESFQEFITELAQTPPEPQWTGQPRNKQIDEWISMFSAESKGQCASFFCPDTPVVFGLFMYLETGALFRSSASRSTYMFFKKFSRLDQRYASSATAFLATLLGMAIEYDSSGHRFDDWFFSQSFALVGDLKEESTTSSDLDTLYALISTMRDLGSAYRGLPEERFISAFKERVVDPPNPPFMDEPFSSFLGGNFDPFRFLALIVATVQFSGGDPVLALRAIAYSFGDTDTTASFLGTLMGAWYGERQLRSIESPGLVFTDELDIVQNVLGDLFMIDLDDRARLFELLRSSAL